MTPLWLLPVLSMIFESWLNWNMYPARSGINAGSSFHDFRIVAQLKPWQVAWMPQTTPRLSMIFESWLNWNYKIPIPPMLGGPSGFPWFSNRGSIETPAPWWSQWLFLPTLSMIFESWLNWNLLSTASFKPTIPTFHDFRIVAQLKLPVTSLISIT